MKRKIITAIIAMMLTMSLCACGNTTNDVNSTTNTEQSSVDTKQDTEQDTEQDTKQDAKSAYSKLTEAYTKTTNVSNGMSSAWEWCINSDSYASSSTIPSYLASEAGLTTDEVLKAYEEINQPFGDDGLYVSLQNFNMGVPVVLKAYMNNGTSDEIQTLLDDAKSLIQNCDESASYYQDLKEYYTAVLNYFNFVFAPDCSYRDLGTRISEYTTKIDTYKSNLSFDLE